MVPAIEQKSVCIIGGGVLGLVAMKLIKESQGLKGTIFEQMDRIGGVWHYVEDTKMDVNQLPVHSAVYPGLRGNGVKEFFALDGLQVPDYENGESFLTHTSIQKYLLEYAEKFDLLDHIQLNTRVLSVKPIHSQNLGKANENDRTKWTVDVHNYKTNTVESHVFDAVIVGNGRVNHRNPIYFRKYFDPVIPEIKGIQGFEGQILHSKFYRRPEQFKGQRVVILGFGPSAIDIGNEIFNVTKSVTVCHRAPFKIPSKTMRIVSSTIARLKKWSVVLENGEEIPCDLLLLATGYNLTYPFLHSDCGIQVLEGKYVTPLYRSMLSVKYPTLCIPNLFSFTAEWLVIQIQMRYFMRYLQGLIKIPTEVERWKELAAEEEESNRKNVPLRHRFRFGNVGQEVFPYLECLAKDGGFPDFAKNICLKRRMFFISLTRLFSQPETFRKDKVCWTSPTSLSYYCYSDPISEDGIPEEHLSLQLEETTGEVIITSSLGKIHNPPFGNF